LKFVKQLLSAIIFCIVNYHGAAFASSLTYTEVEIKSKILNESRTILVSLPDGYDSTPDLSYPVQYVLDGRANILHTRATSDYISRFSEMPRTIIVGITNTNRTRDLTPTIDNSRSGESGNADKFLDFIEIEVFKYVQENYRVANFRSIAGHSLGGLAVLEAFIRNPNLYNAYFVFSGSFTWNDGEHLSRLEESLKTNNNSSAFFYMSMGDEKRDAKPKFLKTESVFKNHANPSIAFHSQIYPEEAHGTIHLRSQHDVYRKLFNGWRIDKYKVENDVGYIEEFIKLQSHKYNFEVKLSETDFFRLSNMFLRKGLFKEAIEICKIRLKYYPNSHYAYRSLADIYFSNGSVEESITSIKKAIYLASKLNDKNLGDYQDKLRTYEN